MLRLVHLFSGVGAPEMALKRLGIPFDIVGYSEIDKYAIQSYKAIHGDAPYLGSVTDIERLPVCDLLFYGSPCQDFSSAGKQKGLRDADGNQTRSGLLLEVERLLEVAQQNDELPKYLIMENVKNLVNDKFKDDFGRWLDKLDELGYNCYWNVLNAKDYGVPQHRERVFVVSIRKDIDFKTFYFPEEEICMPLCIRDILEGCPAENMYLSDDKAKELLAKIQPIQDYPVGTQKAIRLGGLFDSEKSRHQAGAVWHINGVAPTLDTMQGGYRQPLIVQDDKRIRKLTPLECWRCMGFDDADFDKAKETGLSNTQLYKQAGNSIVVPVLEYLLKELIGEN